MAVVDPELLLRWAATAGVVVSGAGFTTTVAPAVPGWLVWGIAFLVFTVFAVMLWRRRLDALELARHREQHRPDQPYRPSTQDEPQY